MVSCFRKPFSYTGEDMIEISCHGSMISVKKILAVLSHYGARPADRGEFTFRAFINGKLDLTQAESVLEVIHSSNDLHHYKSMIQLEGRLKQKIHSLRADIIEILAVLEANIDFSEDEIEEYNNELVQNRLIAVKNEVVHLLDTFRTGKILSDGVRIAIIGPPNVGKSSFLNYILKKDRAIVTDIPGTTRDVLEESIIINNIPFIISDTAGIHTTADTIEQIGIQRSIEKLEESEVIILILDINDSPETYFRHLIPILQSKNTFILFNKTDLLNDESITKVIESFNSVYSKAGYPISIKKETGIETFLEEMVNSLTNTIQIDDNDLIISNVRQKDALLKTQESIENAIQSVNMNIDLDCLIIDVKDIVYHLSDIIGETTTEDVLSVIFEKFCIGK